MTDLLIESLKGLSSAAAEALESLEANDYRMEVRKLKDSNLPLRMMPRTIQDIVDSVIRYCTPAMNDDSPIRSDALLCAKNFQMFTDNLNVTGDREVAHQFQFIDLEPIRAVVVEFKELGLTTQARLLENACNFALGIKRSHNAAPFGHSGKDLAPVSYTIALAPEEVTEDEKEKADQLALFCRPFRKGSYELREKQALYDELRKVIADPAEKKPHLVVMTVIILLRTRRSFKSPLPGSLNSCREDIFGALGLDAKKCHSYTDDSLKKGHTPSLLKYKDKAEATIKTAFGNTH